MMMTKANEKKAVLTKANEKKAVLRKEGVAWVLRTPEGEILRMWSVLAYSVVDVFFICLRRYGVSNVMYSCN